MDITSKLKIVLLNLSSLRILDKFNSRFNLSPTFTFFEINSLFKFGSIPSSNSKSIGKFF